MLVFSISVGRSKSIVTAREGMLERVWMDDKMRRYEGIIELVRIKKSILLSRLVCRILKI